MHKPRSAVCDHCQKPFVYHASKKNIRRFCSNDCYKKNRLLSAYRPCKRCGKPVKKKTNLLYCSMKCLGKIPARPSRKLKCERCGKDFKAVPSKANPQFCSRKCHYDSAELVCVRCGKKFKRSKKQAAKAKENYCSAECVKDRLPVSCIHCGIQMMLPRKEASFTLYCSKKCHSDFCKEKGKLTCAVCKKEFSVPPARKDTAQFCSRRCMSLFKGETSIERMVREALEMLGVAHIPQFAIAQYCLDFFLPLLNVAVEADGDYWHRSDRKKALDKRRDSYLLGVGIITIRLPELIIRNTPDLPRLIASKLGIKPKRRKKAQSLQVNLFEALNQEV